MQILLYFLLTLHVLTCLLIVLVVLMQRPRSEGLGAAFGGGMTENIFGAQTTHVLAKFTTWLGGFFFLVTLALAMVYARINSSESAVERQIIESSQPGAPAPDATAESAAPPAAESAKPGEQTAAEESVSEESTVPAQPGASVTGSEESTTETDAASQPAPNPEATETAPDAEPVAPAAN